MASTSIDIELPDPEGAGENARAFAQNLLEATRRAAGKPGAFPSPVPSDMVAGLVLSLWDALQVEEDEGRVDGSWTVDPFVDEATGRPYVKIDACLMWRVHEFRVDLKVEV